jgi:hypothetical protein
MRRIPLLILLSLLVAHVHADVPADQIERARLLRELDEQRAAVTAEPAAPAAELPGARLDVETLRARQELQYRTGGDQLWRQTLGEQQAGKIREQVTGLPSTAAARAMGAERTLRMQDLSSRILQQDLQYRRERQNMNR